jgi:GDP-4-dehydro-6-deoxy-D-mannose reductase
LLRRGDKVYLAGLERSAVRVLAEREWSSVDWIDCDIRIEDDLHRLFEATRPDVVFHLAGISYVPDAENAPVAAYDVNVVGSVRLLHAAVMARRRGICDPTLLVVGSGTQYGDHPSSAMPLPETAEQRPLSAYASTKAAQEIAALQMSRASGLRVVCTRSFSHSGAGHASVFLLPSLVRRAHALRQSGEQELRIGNDVIRDYLHVDDAVSAYIALAERGKAGSAYNVCSGIGVSVSELAAVALEKAGVNARIVSDVGLRRHADMSILIGSPDRLMQDTGWRPRRTWIRIIDDLMAAEVR